MNCIPYCTYFISSCILRESNSWPWC